MKFTSVALFLVLFYTANVRADKCGCKTMSACYLEMLNDLQEQDEAHCIEDAAVGTSTVTIFLKAIQEYCGNIMNVTAAGVSFDNRNLYEVIVENKRKEEQSPDADKPTIIIDAGQEAGVEAVKFGLYIIQQLVACQENKDMIQNVKWVILPSTNPDGLEFSRYKKSIWRKNLKVDEESLSFGVDISRNFDENWSGCPKVETGFAPDFPGSKSASELETVFIKNVMNNHKANAKIYLSIRRNGHHIGFPYAFSDKQASNINHLEIITAEVAAKVNLRSGGVQSFKNDSIYKLGGKPHCGHSVDYAYATGIRWSFEMRVFLEEDSNIMSMFQTMPRGYDSMLRNGYFSGIRELYNILTNKKKYGHLH